MSEEYIHMVSGAVVIQCKCGVDISSKDDGQSGTDELTFKFKCNNCEKEHKVHAIFELEED